MPQGMHTQLSKYAHFASGHLLPVHVCLNFRGTTLHKELPYLVKDVKICICQAWSGTWTCMHVLLFAGAEWMFAILLKLPGLCCISGASTDRSGATCHQAEEVLPAVASAETTAQPDCQTQMLPLLSMQLHCLHDHVGPDLARLCLSHELWAFPAAHIGD